MLCHTLDLCKSGIQLSFGANRSENGANQDETLEGRLLLHMHDVY